MRRSQGQEEIERKIERDGGFTSHFTQRKCRGVQRFYDVLFCWYRNGEIVLMCVLGRRNNLNWFQILYDFDLLFPQIDGNALHKNWKVLLNKSLVDWKENVDVNKVAAKDENIWKFFVLFDRFKSRGNFYNVIKSLVIFSEVNDSNVKKTFKKKLWKFKFIHFVFVFFFLFLESIANANEHKTRRQSWLDLN